MEFMDGINDYKTTWQIVHIKVFSFLFLRHPVQRNLHKNPKKAEGNMTLIERYTIINYKYMTTNCNDCAD